MPTKCSHILGSFDSSTDRQLYRLSLLNRQRNDFSVSQSYI